MFHLVLVIMYASHFALFFSFTLFVRCFSQCVNCHSLSNLYPQPLSSSPPRTCSVNAFDLGADLSGLKACFHHFRSAEGRRNGRGRLGEIHDADDRPTASRPMPGTLRHVHRVCFAMAAHNLPVLDCAV